MRLSQTVSSPLRSWWSARASGNESVMRRLRLATLGALLLAGWGVVQAGSGRAPAVPGFDFNDDGIADAVFTDAPAGKPARVCFGDGAGGFTGCMQPGGVGFVSSDAAPADVDGDGHVDVVFASAPGNRVCRNSGNGRFTCALLSGPGGDRVALGDLEGDGHLDALFAGFNRPARACLNDGEGRFTCADVSPEALGIVDLALGDLDGDGDLDAVLANRTGSDRLCVNDGRGLFACASVSAERFGTLAVALGDVDGDGDLDAVFAPASQALQLCSNDGRGAFACADLAADARPARGVALRDVDADGDLDLLLASGDGSGRACLNNGRAEFTCSDVEGRAFSKYGVRPAQVDATPKPVPAAAQVAPEAPCPTITVTTPAVTTGTVGLPFSEAFGQSGGAAPTTYSTASALPAGLALSPAGVLAGLPGRLACSAISFAGEQSFAAANGFYSVAVGDFDHDGRSDLALPDSLAGDVAVLRGNGDGTFQADVHFGAGGSIPVSVAVGRFNADAYDDLAVASLDSQVAVLLGNGDGTFQPAVSYGAWSDPLFVVVGDFTGDGQADLAVAEFTPESVSILPGNGDGTFQAAVVSGAGGSPWSLAVGDLDGDGKADLAVTLPLSDKLATLLGNGNGTFQAAVLRNAGASPQSVAVSDVNGDGRLDLAVANNGDTTVSILLGNGSGGFAKVAPDVDVGGNPQFVAVGDFDGDTRVDLAAVNSGADQVATLLGHGNGAFQAPVLHAAASAPQALVLGDFNGDAETDLAVAKYSGGVGIVLNTSPCSSNEGTFPITVTVTDTNACSGSGLYTLTIARIVVSNPAGISAPAGAAIVPRTFSATGAIGATTFSLGTGALPSGLSLNAATGVLSGTPTQTGTFVVRVRATDANGDSGTGAPYTLVITCPAITLTNPALQTAAAGVPFSQIFTQAGGVGAIDFALASGTLPAGLTLDPATGILAGTPMQTGTFSLRVKATDANGCNATGATYALTLTCPAITVTATPPPDTTGIIGLPFSQAFTQTGGVGATSFSTTSLLPGGLTLSPAGALAGTPTVQRCTAVFGAPQTKPAGGAYWYRAATPDLNNDGKPDLVAGGLGPSGGRVDVMLGNGGGTLQPTWAWDLPGGVFGQTLADFNHDAKLDLVVATQNTNTLHEGHGWGGGLFGVGSPLSVVPIHPVNTVARDFDRDGWPDLVTAERDGDPNGGGSALVQLNRFGGSLVDSVTRYPAGLGFAFSVRDMAVEDMNRDSFADVVMVGSGVYAGSFRDLAILFGNGNGTFQNGGVPGQIGDSPSFVRIADVDSDGLPDLVTAHASTTLVKVSLSNGNGSFRVTRTYDIGAHPFSVAVADFNGDGRRDLAATKDSSGVAVLLGNGDGTFQAPITYATGATGPYGIEAADFNNDLKLDLVTVGSGASILLNTYQCFSNLGTYPITVTATDALGCSGTVTHTMSVANCPTITVTNPAGISGTVGTAITPRPFTSFGGAGATSFAIASGALPTGLTLDPATGVLSGTPTQAGTFSITVRATDENGCTGVGATYNLVVCSLITVTNPAGTTGTAGTALAPRTFSASGGAGAISFAIASGTLPAGVTLNASTGVLSGTPLQSGTFAITVRATDANGCSAVGAPYSLAICPVITVTNPAATAGTVGTAIAARTFTASGGVGPVTYLVASGILPAGVTLDTATGVLSGTPTQSGTFTIAVQATDANGCPGVGATYTLAICDVITVTPAPPVTTTGSIGLAYSQSFDQTGGVGPVSFSTVSTLPGGLSLSTAGLLSGTPTVQRCTAIFGPPQTQTTGQIGFDAHRGVWANTDSDPSGRQNLVVAGNGWVANMRSNRDGTFQRTWSYNTGLGGFVTGMTTLDIDRNNRPDVAVASANTSSWHLGRGQGDGSFVVSSVFHSNYSGTFKPVASRDFDHDGWPDVAIAGASAVLLQRSNGSGGLSGSETLVDLVSGGFAFNITDMGAEDMNRDGNADLVVIGSTNGPTSYNLVIVLGRGDGTFFPPTNSFIVDAPSRLRLVDVNNDLTPDLVTVHSLGSTLSVRLNQGNGTFASPRTYAVPGTPRAVAVADFNSDGRRDLAVSSNAGVSVLLGNGDGSFQAPVTYATGPNDDSGLEAGDLDQDGRPDLVTFGSGGFSVLHNTYQCLSNLGTYPIAVKATGADGCSGSATHTLNITNCPTITVTNPAGTSGTVGTAITPRTFTSSGGAGASSFLIASGTLPTGVTLDLATGVLSGTPTQLGTFTITVRAIDSNGCPGVSAAYTLVITCPTISVTVDNPAAVAGTTGLPIAARTFSAAGGSGTYSYAPASGTLPAGVTLDASTGFLSGTPTQPGTFTLTVRATDDATGCSGVGATYTLVVTCPPLTLTPAPADRSASPDATCRAAVPSFATGTTGGGCGAVRVDQSPAVTTLIGLGHHEVHVTLTDTFNNTAVFTAFLDVADPDGDGVCGSADNCAAVFNPGQSNIDGDADGDLCDACPGDPTNTCVPGGSTAQEIRADAGGTVQTADGNVSIQIDPGDLAANTTISVTKAVVANPIVNLQIGTGSTPGAGRAFYDFEPDGLPFDHPVTLTVKVDVGAVAGPPALPALTPLQRLLLKLYRFDVPQNRFIAVPTSCTFAGTIGTCSAEIDHFSRWTVAAPEVAVLDDFERADGELGSNWTGFSAGSQYLVHAQAGQTWYGGPIYWSQGDAFGTDQEAYVTFRSVVGPGGTENGLLLKVQSEPTPANDSDEPDWIKGCIDVFYDANEQRLHVATFRPDTLAWNVYASEPLTLADGDQLHAQARADGGIRVLRNGEPAATFTLDPDDQAFFNSRGGRIGLWFEQAATAAFDDFGGRTVTP